MHYQSRLFQAMECTRTFCRDCKHSYSNFSIVLHEELCCWSCLSLFCIQAIHRYNIQQGLPRCFLLLHNGFKKQLYILLQLLIKTILLFPLPSLSAALLFTLLHPRIRLDQQGFAEFQLKEILLSIHTAYIALSSIISSSIGFAFYLVHDTSDATFHSNYDYEGMDEQKLHTVCYGVLIRDWILSGLTVFLICKGKSWKPLKTTLELLFQFNFDTPTGKKIGYSYCPRHVSSPK